MVDRRDASDAKSAPSPEGVDPAPTLIGRGAAGGRSSRDFPPFFGPFRLHRWIGEGGMSVVYEAEHRLRRRPEALKVLQRRLTEDPQVVERFHREVRAMAAIRNDHVVPVYDSGEVDGELYYTMPLLAGPSLQGLLVALRASGERVPAVKAQALLDAHGLAPSDVKGDRPEAAYARRIAGALAGVAEALAAMHDADVLHRDLKPSNLMLDSRARVLIADFGLVRTGEDRITDPDESLGTPAYMSPEQILPPEDEAPDGRADIYAFGVTLFELLTLELPHQGDTIAETLALVLEKRAASVRDTNPLLPKDIETIVSRCLEGERTDRYPDAARLARDLRAFSRGEEIRTRPVGWPRRIMRLLGRHWKPLAAVGLVVVAACAWYFTRPAYLSIRTFPEGRLFVDQADVGTTPVNEHALGPGVHEIRVESEDPRFAPLLLHAEFDRLEEKDVERVLPARDPTDPEVLAIYAERMGVTRSVPVAVTEIARTRAAKGRARTHAVWPRGRVRSVPTAVVLWASRPVEGARAELVAAGQETPVETWEVPAVAGEISLPLSVDAQRRLRPDVLWTLRVRGPRGVRSKAVFQVAAPALTASLEGRLASVDAAFSEGDPARRFLRADVYLEEGFFAAALAETEALHTALGPEPAVARLALTVLKEADLQNVGPWFPWTRVWQDGLVTLR